jgi:uncharacterized protein (TIGR02996 family)
MLMNLEEAFLRAIQEDPGDGLTWDALADWLEERGDRRGELLRLHRSLREHEGGPGGEQEKRLNSLLASGVRPCVPTLTNSLDMMFVLVPPGSFVMGSPSTEPERGSDEIPHEVEITRPFFLGVTPLTQEQYRKLIRHNPSHFSALHEGRHLISEMDTSTFPVESVSWQDAQTFCHRLSQRPSEVRARHRYRLPTEAEWEYACREAGAARGPFYLGQTLSATQANFDGRHPYGGAGRGAFLGRTCPVASYPPNALGLYDMHGNVWEWCSDYYDTYDVSVRQDPRGPANGNRVVVRGGSYSNHAKKCRSARRDFWYGTSWKTPYIGMRLVCEVNR